MTVNSQYKMHTLKKLSNNHFQKPVLLLEIVEAVL